MPNTFNCEKSRNTKKNADIKRLAGNPQGGFPAKPQHQSGLVELAFSNQFSKLQKLAVMLQLKKSLSIGLFTLIAVTLMMASCEEDAMITDVSSHKALLDEIFTHYDIIEIDFDKHFDYIKENLNSEVVINFNFPSHPNWEFVLNKDDLSAMYSDKFRVYEVTQGNALIERELHEIIALEGNMKKSNAPSFFTFALGRMEGSIMDEHGEEYYLEALVNYDEKASQNQYVLYNTKDVIISENPICEDYEREPDDRSIMDGNSGDVKGTNCWKVEVTYLGDYKLYHKKFGNNWNNAVNWMWNRWYYGQKRYWAYNGFNLNWLLKNAYLYTSPNPEPHSRWNSGTFVGECNDYHNYSWYDRGDVNMIWTGYNVSGVWGKANGIAKMCRRPRNSYCFGEKMSTGSLSNNLMAHEIGHTMGIYHDNSSQNFMNSNYNYWNSSIGNNARDDLNWHLWFYNGCLGMWACQ